MILFHGMNLSKNQKTFLSAFVIVVIGVTSSYFILKIAALEGEQLIMQHFNIAIWVIGIVLAALVVSGYLVNRIGKK